MHDETTTLKKWVDGSAAPHDYVKHFAYDLVCFAAAFWATIKSTMLLSRAYCSF